MSEVAKETYTSLNNTFNKVGDKLNKVFEELSQDLHLDKIIKDLEIEGLDGDFVIGTGISKETSKINPEKNTEVTSKLEIKNGLWNI